MDKIEEEPLTNEISDKEEVKESEGLCLPEPQSEQSSPDASLVANVAGKGIELETDEFQRRVESMKEHISKLKESIKEEKEFFRREIDEINKLQLQMVEYNSKILEVASEMDNLGNWLSKCSLVRVESKEYCLLDPTQQMKWYHGAVARSQANRRLNLQRQISGNIYKKKLFEAEQMCKVELSRIGESVRCLEPLKKTVSEWNLQTDADHPRSGKPVSTDLTLSQTASSTKLNISRSGEKIAGDQISVKMNTNLNMVEVQAPLWRGDGYPQMKPLVSPRDAPDQDEQLGLHLQEQPTPLVTQLDVLSEKFLSN